MKWAVLSDIHGNLEALEATLAALGEVDAYLCLGDIVGYGANPNECCDIVRKLCPEMTLMGNHDAGVLGRLSPHWFNPYARFALEWTRSVLTRENWDFLQSLPHRLEGEGWMAVHGSLVDPWEYITSPWEARPSFERLTVPLAFFGHTHLAEYYLQEEGHLLVTQHPWSAGESILLAAGRKYLVNPGSIGQPRDRDWRASAALFDAEARTITLLRVEYNLAEAQSKIFKAGLPPFLAERLAWGY